MSEKKHKVMYLMDIYQNPYAGTEGQLRKLIQGYENSEFDVELTVFRSSDYVENNDFPCKINILDIKSMARFGTIIKLIKFCSYLKREKFQLVHILFNDASIIAPIFIRLSGIKVIITRLDMGYWYTSLNKLILRFNRFFLDGAIANGEAVKKATHINEGIPNNKIHVIYNGYEDVQLDQLAIYSPQQQLGMADDAFIVGIVANIRPIKRMQDLVRAIALVAKKHTSVNLMIVGGGDQSELRELASELNIEKHIYFLGQQSNVLPIIKSLDVAVLCSESEGFSNAIIEYMKCSKPVICTNVGGNPEIVEHGHNGFLIEMGDFQSLAKHIKNLLIDTPLRDKMGINASQSVSVKFKMEKMMDAHTHLYMDLIEG